jgi:hypothetical protein
MCSSKEWLCNSVLSFEEVVASSLRAIPYVVFFLIGQTLLEAVFLRWLLYCSQSVEHLLSLREAFS